MDVKAIRTEVEKVDWKPTEEDIGEGDIGEVEVIRK